jgi:hypothetical protein
MTYSQTIELNRSLFVSYLGVSLISNHKHFCINEHEERNRTSNRIKTAKLLICNCVNDVPLGDYAAQIEIGPNKAIANVILDTGSSTLAIWKDKFTAVPTKPTNFIQFVGFVGTGHWAGPVLTVQVGIGIAEHYIGLPSVYVSQIQSGHYHEQKQFYPADGILGL